MKVKQVEIVRNGNIHSVRWVPIPLGVRKGTKLVDKLGRKWEVIEDYPSLEWTPPSDMACVAKNAWRKACYSK